MANVQESINIIFELLWMLVRLNYVIIKSVVQMFIPSAPKDVKEEIILITGTGHGMGREMALRFARLGAIIICVDINNTSNEETAKMIKQERGVAHVYQCDVTDRAAVMELANKVRRDVGDVTMLVNNAGIMPCKPLLQQTEQEIRLMNDINVNGNLWMIQAFLPAMIARDHGHIVAMSSIAGLMESVNLVPYCGSKFAVRGIMEALALELHLDPKRIDGIKLTTIYPYIVDTGLCKKPRIRFPKLGSIVDVNDAADMIVDAVRKELTEITIPHGLHYVNRITGTGHGMGREMALRFARLGAIIICVDINSSSNEETAKIIKQERGIAHTYQCDVTNRAAVMELANKVRRDVGDVTILVNNAGIMPCKPLLQQTEQEIRLMNDINVSGNLWMIQAFLSAMIARDRGHIVAMSSMAGRMGLDNLVPYCGSKYAVRGIMEALALELHTSPKRIDGIKLTTIYPYIVDTGLCKKPRIRFPKINKIVDVNDAADMIVDAVRRELTEITIPHELHYLNKFVYELLPRAAKFIGYDFFNTGVDAHDD